MKFFISLLSIIFLASFSAQASSIKMAVKANVTYFFDLTDEATAVEKSNFTEGSVSMKVNYDGEKMEVNQAIAADGPGTRTLQEITSHSVRYIDSASNTNMMIPISSKRDGSFTIKGSALKSMAMAKVFNIPAGAKLDAKVSDMKCQKESSRSLVCKVSLSITATASSR